MEGNPPIPEVQEGAPLIPITQWGNSPVLTTPPPSSMDAYFDWSRLVVSHLPSYVSFEITLQAYNMDIPSTIIDESASLSILSSNTWKALGSP